MEPTAEELASFRTAKDLCDWAELLDTEDAATSPRRTFLAALGATENTKLFLLAAIPESIWQYIMTEWNIGNLKPTAIQLASAGYIGIAARLASGTIPTRAQREQQKLSEMELELARAKAVPISALSSPGLIKMSTIIDQASDREVAPLGESEVEAYYAVYRKLMGHDPRPEEDITAEQLAGATALAIWNAAADVQFWRKELEEKARLILAKISRPLDNVEGDALTSSQPGPKRPRDLGAKYSSAPPPHKKRDFERVHRTTADGSSSHDRRGLELCAAFQKGECEASVRDGICPRNSSHRHQCARCLLMGHGLSDCKGKPVADITSNRKGKGKS